jgi:hypothetical protein
MRITEYELTLNGEYGNGTEFSIQIIYRNNTNVQFIKTVGDVRDVVRIPKNMIKKFMELIDES